MALVPSTETSVIGRIGRFFEDNVKMVKVYVGPRRKLWTLPEDYLCDRVDYFKAAFKGDFQEGHEKEIHLEEEDPKAFGMLIDWMFRDTLECDCPGYIYAPGDYHCPAHLEWCKLYVLADKFVMESLMEQILARLSRCFTPPMLGNSARSLKYVYDNTTESSKLRKWFVDRATSTFFTCDGNYMGTWVDVVMVHRDFNLGVAEAIKYHLGVDKKDCMYRYNACAIHIHSVSHSDSDSYSDD